MTSAGGTALTALAVPAAFKKLPGGGPVPRRSDGTSSATRRPRSCSRWGRSPGACATPAPVTAATARRRAGPSPACRVWGSRSAASGRARSWSTTAGMFGPWNFGGSQYSDGGVPDQDPPAGGVPRSRAAGGQAGPRSRRGRPRGRRTSDRRARSRPGSWGDPLPGKKPARPGPGDVRGDVPVRLDLLHRIQDRRLDAVLHPHRGGRGPAHLAPAGVLRPPHRQPHRLHGRPCR